MVSSDKIVSWLKLMRLQFYSMPLVVYTLGALIFYRINNFFLFKNFFIGYLIIFLIELETVLTNEYYDFEADKLNKNPTRFTGGSRMLVENKISIKEVKYSIAVVFLIIILLSAYLLKITSFSNEVYFLLFIGIILCISYTAPPLKLSYRGFGELNVAFIHGFYVITCGYVFQKSILDAPIILIVGISIFFSSLAGVSLAGLPDLESDRLVSKKSLASILGYRNTLIFSAICAVITGALSIYLGSRLIIGVHNYLYFFITIYSIVLAFVLLRQIKNSDIRIDKLILKVMILIAISVFVPLIIFLIDK